MRPSGQRLKRLLSSCQHLGHLGSVTRKKSFLKKKASPPSLHVQHPTHVIESKGDQTRGTAAASKTSKFMALASMPRAYHDSHGPSHWVNFLANQQSQLLIPARLTSTFLKGHIQKSSSNSHRQLRSLETLYSESMETVGVSHTKGLDDWNVVVGYFNNPIL